MILRGYQTRAIDGAREAFRAGAKRVLIVAPTGSGKTCMASDIVARHLARSPDNRVVWLAHRTELLDQATKAIASTGLDVSLRGANPSARVEVESVQAILARERAPKGTLLIADEAHHYVDSGRWGEIVPLYPLVLGLTATPERGDGKPLSFFERLVVAAQIRELTQLGYLVPLRVRFPVPALGKDKIAQAPVDAYLSECAGQRAIVFAPHVKAATEYLQQFRGRGVTGAIVTGLTARATRADVLAMHRRGALQVIINCGVLTEGYDDPGVDCIIVARRCESQGLWLQMTGRGLRPADGKTHCTLLDLTGIVHSLGRPDADREFSLTGEPITVTTATRYSAARLCKVCKAALDDTGICAECGAENGMIVPEATGADLVSWEDFYQEVRDTLKPRRDAISLAGIMRKCRRNGAVDMQSAKMRFQAIFKRFPDDHCIRQARELNAKSDVEYARALEDRDRKQADLMARAREQRIAQGGE